MPEVETFLTGLSCRKMGIVVEQINESEEKIGQAAGAQVV